MHIPADLIARLKRARRRSQVLASEPNAAQPEPEGGRRLEPPRCSHCGGRIRPGVVWFGECLPRQPWEQAVDAARGCDAFLCVGTSSVVEPAASMLPELLTQVWPDG